jgi:hypothetical protein
MTLGAPGSLALPLAIVTMYGSRDRLRMRLRHALLEGYGHLNEVDPDVR